MSGLIAIHQPNFFPWLGYFDKIRRADAFVFLDAVAYPRAGSGGMGSWTNRVRIAIQGEARFIACPLRHLGFAEPILAATIADEKPWRTKLLKTMEANYRRAPCYERTMNLLNPLILNEQRNLSAFNIAAIGAIAEYLGLRTRFVRQSDLAATGQSTELLASLVKAVGGNAYLTGGGAGGYQNDSVFAACGIKAIHQDFVPKPYGKQKRFLPGLSVIDYLMHDGRPLVL